MPTDSTRQDASCKLDWLAFTLPHDIGLEAVRDLFGVGAERERGTRGYSKSATLPCGGVVSWSPQRPEMKVHVELASSHLSKALEQCPAAADTWGMLKYLHDLGASFTRVDFAWDDRDGRLSMATIGRHVREKWLTSRWRKGRHILGTLEAQGETYEFGSRASNSFLRIYDKQAERIDKGEDDPGHWIRVELELKHEKATRAVCECLTSSYTFLTGLLGGLLQFREPGEDGTKSRWALAQWWGDFLGWVEKQVLAIPKALPTMERDQEWMTRQWSRTFARRMVAEAGDMGWLHDLGALGRTKLTDEDYVRAKNYQTWRLSRQEAVRSAV